MKKKTEAKRKKQTNKELVEVRFVQAKTTRKHKGTRGKQQQRDKGKIAKKGKNEKKNRKKLEEIKQ